MIKRHHLKALCIVTLSIMTVTTGCANNKDTVVKEQEPELNQIQSICEMATLKCTYHNVARTTKAPSTGILHIGEKPRKFWIDYQGTVEISFDVNKIQMHQKKTSIDITLPAPNLKCDVVSGSWNDKSYIIEPDHLFFQKNPITADDQTQAINSAQTAMKEQVEKNSSLITTAESQAKQLITNYIDRIGDATSTKYTITWHSTGISESSNSTATTSSTESAK